MKLTIGIILLLLIPTLAASDAGTPLERASEAYLKNGAEAFIIELMKGSPLEGEKSVATQSNNLRQIEDYYGKYIDYDVVLQKNLTDKVRIVYYVMNYEKSPVFGVANYYKIDGDEVVTSFNFNTEWAPIIPMAVLFND